MLFGKRTTGWHNGHGRKPVFAKLNKYTKFEMVDMPVIHIPPIINTGNHGVDVKQLQRSGSECHSLTVRERTAARKRRELANV